MDGLKELELLRAFFARWETLHALPAALDKASLEYRAKETAAKHLVEAAQAVRNLRNPPVRPEVIALRRMHQQTAEIPPKDGFKPYG